MTRSLMLLVRIVLLSCFLVAADFASSTAAAATDTDVAGVVADADNPNKLLNNLLYDFVETNDRFDDVFENTLKNYLFNKDDLYNKGNLMATPDDHSDLVDDNLTNEKATGNQLTFTKVDGNYDPTSVTESFVDFPTLIVDQHIADGHYTDESTMKTSTTPTKIIHQKHHTEAWPMTTGKSPTHGNQTHHRDATREGSSNQRQRNLASCVSSASGLARAVKQATTTKSSSIKVCTSRIPMGSLNRRRRRSRRRLQSSSFSSTNVSLTGLAGGIDFSNRSILFQCLLKRRCILDGEGISRIFYGTNATISIDGFQFLNASSQVGDALGSGSALTLIGSSQVTIRDSSFVYNTAPSVGGAIMINNSTLTLTNSRRKIQFLKNEATYGGAIFGVYATIQTNITTSSPSGIIAFQDNNAIGDGGSVYVTSSSVGWNKVTFEKNDASNGGGAAIFIDTNVTMTNMNVFGNVANLKGGAFVFVGSNVVINNSTFDANNGYGKVEAITSTSSNVQVNDSTFSRSSWYVDSSTTLNLTNSCLPQGSNCVLGSTCSYCCQPYLSWSTKLSYYCGPNPHNVKTCFGSDGQELSSALTEYSSGDANIIANLTNIYGNISDWCTSSIFDWTYTFYGRSSFNENISNWDTSNAIGMLGMFYGASSFNQDISKWDTSKVQFMKGMFLTSYSFNQDISKWDTSQVTDMSSMFDQASSFNQDISRWDISKVKDMNGMFYNASSFNQNLCAWKNKCQSIVFSNVFLYTSCPNQSDPICGTGPFCYTCP